MNSTAAAAAVSETSDLLPPRIWLAEASLRAREDSARLRFASWAYTTRRVPPELVVSVMPPSGKPSVGDLVLARVDAIGYHANLQLANGRLRHMFVGDEIVVTYGNRYASSQFESEVPDNMGPCHLVAGGGIASRTISWHARATAKGPTRVTPIGLLATTDGRRVNLRDFALEPLASRERNHPTTIAVVGTSMDSGKTQTATFLVKGLISAGLKVGYAKVTGTGAGGDIWWLKDAGADPVLDFTDAGLPTTYRASPEEVEGVLSRLVAHVACTNVDAIVIEIADGVLQRETAALLRSPAFTRLAGGVVLAAQDSMGASAGVHWLRRESIPVMALSGVLTAAPLQIAEAGEDTNLPVYNRGELATPSVALDLIDQADRRLDGSVITQVAS